MKTLFYVKSNIALHSRKKLDEKEEHQHIHITYYKHTDRVITFKIYWRTSH